jgi:hypothetical protein
VAGEQPKCEHVESEPGAKPAPNKLRTFAEVMEEERRQRDEED